MKLINGKQLPESNEDQKNVLKKIGGYLKRVKNKVFLTVGAGALAASLSGQCTKTIHDGNTIPLNGVTTQLVPGATGTFQEQMIYSDNTDGNDNLDVEINGTIVNYGTYNLFGGDVVKWHGMIEGADGITVQLGSAGGPECTENWVGTGDVEEEESVPVETTSFESELISYGHIQVERKIAQQQNVSKLEFERSYDGVTFTKFGELEGNGDSNEEMTLVMDDRTFDRTVENVYYRGKNIDNDGKFSYTKITGVANEPAKAPTFASAIPAIGGEVTIAMEDVHDNIEAVKVYDESGKEITPEFNIEPHGFTVFLGNYPSGIYNIVIHDKAGGYTTLRPTVNNN